MKDLKLDGLTGKTIKEAEVDGFGIRMVFTDDAVFDYDASDGGYSQYELTEATAEAMQKQIDHVAESDRKVSISCGRENDLISRQEAIDTIMGQPPEPHYPAWYAAQIEILPAVQPDHTADVSKKVERTDETAQNVSDPDLVSRKAAIDALHEQIKQCNRALSSLDISPKDEYAIKVERASLKAYKEQLENMPPAQPERDIPIKPVETTDTAWGIPHRQAVCPKCDCYLGHVAFLGDYKGKKVTYCETCGQAIDWKGWNFDE